MKKILFIILLICSQAVRAQINVTLSANPPANTAQWGTGGSVFNIIVTGSASLIESRVLLTIKSNGTVRCGVYTPASAPSSNIISASPKSWIGQAATALLGQDCVLPPGSYEICVQFYKDVNGIQNKLVMQNDCRTIFTIPEKTQEICSPPMNLNPTEKKIFTDKDILKPLTFNWSPVFSSNHGIVTYHLMVWEVEDGQTVAQAIYNNSPVIDEEVRGQTRYVTRPSVLEKRNARYVWRVIALDQQGLPICKNAQSAPTEFEVEIPETAPDCINFEGQYNSSNWIGFHVSGISVAHDVPHGNYLKLTDGPGGSIAVNYIEFAGDWLKKGKNGCLCFDYMVDWNADPTINTLAVKAPKIGIYNGAPIANVPPYGTTLGTGINIRAGFVGNPTNPDIKDNEWRKFCLPLSLCVGGLLPSNAYGHWVIADATGPLTGAAACTAWDNLIQNVTGFYLATDYNSEPSEIVNFDNFCWTCDGVIQPPTVECCDKNSEKGCLITDTTQMKIECIGVDSSGKNVYKVSNLILKNTGKKKAKTGLSTNLAGTNYIEANPSGSFSVSNLTPSSVNPISNGQQVNISFEVHGASGTSISLLVDGSILSKDGNCDLQLPVELDSLPDCNSCGYCNDSTKSRIKIQSKTVNVTALNTIALAQQFTINPKNITKITAELVFFSEVLRDTSCLQCLGTNNAWQFIPLNTASWNSGVSLTGSPGNNAGMFPSKKIMWFCNKQGTLDINLVIGLPQSVPGRTCSRKGKFCIRYSFTDADCKTCEKLIWYSYNSN